MTKALPTQELLRQLLDYDPETGVLTWKVRPLEMFPAGHHARSWNTKNAGHPALSILGTKGYLAGNILGFRMRSHRAIWVWVTGQYPDQIDHIDGDRTNNKWLNLRNVTGFENQKNMARSARNSSGVIGVHWKQSHQKWTASIRGAGKNKTIGQFDHFEEAVAARATANIQYGFHSNHGRAA